MSDLKSSNFSLYSDQNSGTFQSADRLYSFPSSIEEKQEEFGYQPQTGSAYSECIEQVSEEREEREELSIEARDVGGSVINTLQAGEVYNFSELFDISYSGDTANLVIVISQEMMQDGNIILLNGDAVTSRVEITYNQIQDITLQVSDKAEMDWVNVFVTDGREQADANLKVDPQNVPEELNVAAKGELALQAGEVYNFNELFDISYSGDTSNLKITITQEMTRDGNVILLGGDPVTSSVVITYNQIQDITLQVSDKAEMDWINVFVTDGREQADAHIRVEPVNVQGNGVIGGTFGDDIIEGGSGDDHILAWDGNDKVFGGQGDDLIEGGYGDDTLYGGDGNDTLIGGDADDVLYGGQGDDRIIGGDGRNEIFGGDGHDTIFGGSSDSTVDAGDGDDYVYASTGDDTVMGGAGDDHLEGAEGHDNLDGGTGDDILNGGEGADTIQGGEGADRIHGGSEDDVLYGDHGNDVIFGGSGSDELYGGWGDDILVDGFGRGDDVLIGGEGADTFVITETSHEDITRIEDFSMEEGDALDLHYILDGMQVTPEQALADELLQFVSREGGEVELHIGVDGAEYTEAAVVFAHGTELGTVEEMIDTGAIIL